MELIRDIQTATFKYATMLELTNHVKTMGENGWSIIVVSSASLKVTYRKNLLP